MNLTPYVYTRYTGNIIQQQRALPLAVTSPVESREANPWGVCVHTEQYYYFNVDRYASLKSLVRECPKLLVLSCLIAEPKHLKTLKA